MRLWLMAAAAVVMVAGATQAQTLERIKDSGTFKIGYREDALPFSYKNPLGEPAGYSVDLCRAIAEGAREALRLDQLELAYVPVTTEDRFQAVQDGRIDLLCGATTVTLGRRERVDFSLFTFIDGAGVLMPPDGPETFEGLAGKKIGVRGATTTEEALRITLERLSMDAEVISVASHDEGLAKLEAGEIAAYFADHTILLYLGSKSQMEGLWISERQFTHEPYALALTKGDSEFRLLVDTVLSRLYRSGQIEKVFINAFGDRAEPTGLVRALYVISGLPE